MLGATVAGLACWDRGTAGGRRGWLAAGWLLLALGFAIKIIAAFLLIPLVFVVLRSEANRPDSHRVHDPPARAGLVRLGQPPGRGREWLPGVGRQPRDLAGPHRAFGLAACETWELIGWFLFVRAFTPWGAVLALVGLLKRRAVADDGRRLWWVWGLSASVTLAILAQKLHHEYYFLILAPVAAAGIGSALNDLVTAGRWRGFATLAVLIVLCLLQARSTWRTGRVAGPDGGVPGRRDGDPR